MTSTGCRLKNKGFTDISNRPTSITHQTVRGFLLLLATTLTKNTFSYSAWPVIGHGANSLSPQKARLAMGLRAKNMHYRLGEIRARHYRELADKSGVPTVWDKMQALIENVPPSLAAVEKRLASDFPRILWERISNGMLSQADAFKKEILGSGPV